MFESSVNPKGIKTADCIKPSTPSFESSVNPKGIKTELFLKCYSHGFESSVNPKGIKTLSTPNLLSSGLRVV